MNEPPRRPHQGVRPLSPGTHPGAPKGPGPPPDLLNRPRPALQPEPTARTPLVRRRWFWTLVGIALIGLGGALWYAFG